MAKKIRNIHDKFTKALLSNKEMAVAFIESYLPTEINEIIETQSLEYIETSYITDDMRNVFSDLVVNVTLKNSTKIKLCFLFEHKSYIDEETPFQILEYLALAYKNQRKEKKKFELIVPILYYNGKTKWEYQPLYKLFDHFPASLQKYLPTFHTEFIDLRSLGEKAIEEVKNELFKSALLAQFYYFEDINNRISEIAKNLSNHLDSNLVDIIFVYLLQNENLKKEKLFDSLKTISGNLNNKVMSIYDELMQEGIKKGKAEGKAEGIAVGKAQGIAVGKAQGIAVGKAEGIEEGIEKGIEKTILNAFDNHINLDTIRVITGESMEKINSVLMKNLRI
jgi:predicted transposase/invertase (TIGR01784 family)